MTLFKRIVSAALVSLLAVHVTASGQFSPGQVLTARELNNALETKTNSVSAAIAGDTIDGTAIVLTTPAAGTFSTLGATNRIVSGSEYLSPLTGSGARAVNKKLDERVSVLNFPGCDPTGVSDSTTCIQTAINALGSAGGGTLGFPRGIYKINSTILVTNSNIKLIGASEGSFHYAPATVEAAVKFNWAGGAASMVSFDPSYPRNSHWLSGNEFRGIYLAANNTATVGLSIKSVRNGRFVVMGDSPAVTLFYGGVSLPGYPLSDTADCQQNYIEVTGNITQAGSTAALFDVSGQNMAFSGYASGTTLTVTSISAGNYVVPGTVLVGSGNTSTNPGVTINAYGSGSTTGTGGLGTYQLSGPLTQYPSGSPGAFTQANADFSSNYISYIDGNVQNGSAVQFHNADNNIIRETRIFVGGTGTGILLNAGGWGQSARQNYFQHVGVSGIAGSTIISQGPASGTWGAISNVVEFLDMAEGGSLPSIAKGSSLFYGVTNEGSGAPTYVGSMPAVSAATASGGPYSSGRDTTVTWDSVTFDLLGNFASNTFTAPKPGIYKVNLLMSSTNSVAAGDKYEFDLVVSGTYAATKSLNFEPVSANQTSISHSGLFRMAAGDTLVVKITKGAGTGSWTPVASTSWNSLDINYVSQSW